MFELEPGPLELGEFPLPARIAREGLFETHAADYIDARGADANVLPQASLDVAGEGVPDQEGAYAFILGAAEATTDAETNTPDEGVPDAVYTAGGNVNARAAQAAPFLPDADSDVPTNFASPPQPPTNGFVDTYHPPTLPDGDQPNQGPDQQFG